MADRKAEGQYMTPDDIVSMILNSLGYTGQHILTKTIIAIVQNGIATNKDAAYIVHIYLDKELINPYMGKHSDRKRIVYFCDKNGGVRPIESSILHRCVKASKYNGVIDNTYIIFPYEKNPVPKFFTRDGKEVESEYQPLTESKLKYSFPKAYEYLSSLKMLPF